MKELCTLTLDAHAVIGAAPEARATAQPLHLDLQLWSPGDEATTIDIPRLQGELHFLLVASRFRLLASAAEAVARWVLAPPIADSVRPQLAACALTLSTSGALGPPERLSIRREAREVNLSRETKDFGFIDIILEVEEVGVYRERVSAGKSVPTHVHRGLDESELVLGEGLVVQGHLALPGQARSWPRDYPHRWDNPTPREQSFLCIDRPRFVHTDEIEVPTPLSELRDVEVQRYF